MAWEVVCRPVGENMGKNDAGLKVLLVEVDGDDEREVGRVAFVRRNSKNPDVAFSEVLQDLLDRAVEAATTLDELDEQLEAARAESVAVAKKRITEVLGRAPTWNAKAS